MFGCSEDSNKVDV